MVNVENLTFELPNAENALRLAKYFYMRDNKTCDSGMLDTYLWKDYYKVRGCTVDDKALLLVMEDEEGYFTSLPWCAKEDLSYSFGVLQEYFNQVLKQPLKIYFADEEGVQALELLNNPEYLVEEEEDARDYLYDGEELRTLQGKAMQKKRNRANKFRREYEGRYEYVTLGCEDKAALHNFLDTWFAEREDQEHDSAYSLRAEKEGIKYIANHCTELPYRAGCIYIDGQPKAFSVGSYNPRENMAVISIEKADSEYEGLYQVINQEFLQHEFPNVAIVNREDDLGLPGLRKAKESYYPIGYARKYRILQKKI